MYFRVDMFIPQVDIVGGFSMYSSPEQLQREGTLDLAVKYSKHPPALWVHRKVNDKRLLYDIFHISPGIHPRLPYQARQRSWRADMGWGWIPGTIWKISCHNLFITYFTLTFPKHWLLYWIYKIFELTNCKNKSLRELPFFNLQIFLFRIWFQKHMKQCRSVQWR